MGVSRAKRAQVTERRRQAVQMRLAGVDWETIAERLGYASKGAACTDVDRALKESTTELRTAGEELRTLQVLRVDRLLAAVWTKAVKGDLKAVDTALRLLDRHAKLHGLDAPSRMSVDAEQLGAEIGDLLTALGQSDDFGDDVPGVPGDGDEDEDTGHVHGTGD